MRTQSLAKYSSIDFPFGLFILIYAMYSLNTHAYLVQHIKLFQDSLSFPVVSKTNSTFTEIGLFFLKNDHY